MLIMENGDFLKLRVEVHLSSRRKKGLRNFIPAISLFLGLMTRGISALEHIAR